MQGPRDAFKIEKRPRNLNFKLGSFTTSKDSGTNKGLIHNQTWTYAIQAIQLTSDSVQGKLRSAVVSAASLWCLLCYLSSVF
jgi:hypothetical protein